MLLNILKYIYPEPSAKDIKSFLLVFLVIGTFTFYAKDYVDAKDNGVKSQIVKRQEVVQKTINKNQIVLMAYLKDMKQDQRDLNKELKDALKRTDQKVWELSRSKN